MSSSQPSRVWPSYCWGRWAASLVRAAEWRQGVWPMSIVCVALGWSLGLYIISTKPMISQPNNHSNPKHIVSSSHTTPQPTPATQPGPSVPALAAELGQRETKLAGIFTCRGLGFLTGSFATSFLVGGWVGEWVVFASAL